MTDAMTDDGDDGDDVSSEINLDKSHSNELHVKAISNMILFLECRKCNLKFQVCLSCNVFKCD
jgi:hypothetical protein